MIINKKTFCLLVLIAIFVSSCNNYVKTCNTYKKGKNPLRKVYASICQIKNMHPVKITIERWADEKFLPFETFDNEIKKEAKKTGKSVDEYFNDPNNSQRILKKMIESFNDPKNWIVESEITEKYKIKMIMEALAKSKEVGVENSGLGWTERICFKDNKGKVKWTPFLISPPDVYVGDGHYEEATYNVFTKILNIKYESSRNQDSNQPVQKLSD